MKAILLNLLILSLFLTGEKAPVTDSHNYGECTIGVFSGSVTADGRPMLWKNRDVTRPVQKFCYYESPHDADDRYSYIANCYSDDTTRVYMGMNEAGFAIINSNSYNLGDSLPQGVDDGTLLRMALEKCRTLADFELLLDLTAVKGRQDCWNIGAFDENGDAAMYECSNNDYVKYDANNPRWAPRGVILRATFGLSGSQDNRIGIERYKRVTRLVDDRIREQPIDAEFVLQKLSRDLANPIEDPYPLPYDGQQEPGFPGFINTSGITINRDVSRSCMVIRGTKPGEDQRLGTLFCLIGPPVISVAFPLWIGSKTVPPMLNLNDQTPMYSIVSRHRTRLYPLGKYTYLLDSRYLLDDQGNGLYNYTLPLEKEAIQMADNYVRDWNMNLPSTRQMAEAQQGIADIIFRGYEEIPLGRFDDIKPRERKIPGIANYPNPFNAKTVIHLNGFERGEAINVNIYDLLGREVRSFSGNQINDFFIVWDGTDNDNRPAASGVYLIRAESDSHRAGGKALLMK